MPPADIERAYNNSIERCTTPEQVRASHILLKTEGKDDAAVKAQAEEMLKQAKAGADFAELAKKYSEDEASAKNGGDLDYFGRGRMVPEFDQAAFALQPGQISDLGEDAMRLSHHQAGRQERARRPGRSPTSASRSPISSPTSARRRRPPISAQSAGKADQQAGRSRQASPRRRDCTVQESGFFARDEPILGLGPSPEAAQQGVRHEARATWPGRCRASRGFVFETLVAKQDPYVPKLDEVKDARAATR